MGCGPSVSGESDMGKSEKLMKAALLIQKWYRRYSARLEARRLSAWKIYQSIEYAGEQDQLKLYNFFNHMLDFLPPDQNSNQHLSSVITSRFTSNVTRTESEQELLQHTDYSTIRVNPSYKGPRLTFPLTRKQLSSLVDDFKRGKVLHARFLLELLHHTRRLLKTKSNVNHVNLNLTKQLTICGDLHGKLDDLFTIFYKNGLPSPDNPYIFNGDFVDRGTHSVEVAALLFTCLLLFPNNVHINRGNHEDSVMNMRYGFMKEVLNKYKEHGSKIFTLFEEVFSWLPLAAMIDKKILVVHGGISDTTSLDTIESLDRHKYISVLKPPYSLKQGCDTEDENVERPKMADIIEWNQVLDILWSDPKTQLGCSQNSFRGGGCYFGADVTEKFLRKNSLKLIIRSHECKRDGYEYSHYKQVLTIFSASNYYEEGSNKGAYIKLYQDHKLDFVQYVTTKASRGRKITIRQRVGIIEASAIRDLKERIFASGLQLKHEFRKFDPDNSGKLHVNDWCCAMENVLHMELPWRTLREKLADLDEDGKVNVASMFDFCHLRCNFTTAQEGPSLTETLYRNKDSLGTIFRIIDKDNSGSISMQEFEDACDILSRHIGHTISKEQVADLARCLDINKDGQIDFNEFLEAFRLVDQQPRTDDELVSLSLASMSDKESDLVSRSSGSTVNII